jgi:hypothetical protein
MKAGIFFTDTGPILILSSYESSICRDKEQYEINLSC